MRFYHERIIHKVGETKIAISVDGENFEMTILDNWKFDVSLSVEIKGNCYEFENCIACNSTEIKRLGCLIQSDISFKLQKIGSSKDLSIKLPEYDYESILSFPCMITVCKQQYHHDDDCTLTLVRIMNLLRYCVFTQMDKYLEINPECFSDDEVIETTGDIELTRLCSHREFLSKRMNLLQYQLMELMQKYRDISDQFNECKCEDYSCIRSLNYIRQRYMSIKDKIYH